MSHKVLINGTAYAVAGGDALVNGTKYQLGGGKTLVNGAAYDIVLSGSEHTISVVNASPGRAYVIYNGKTFTEDFSAKDGDSITVYIDAGSSDYTATVYLNNKVVKTWERRVRYSIAKVDRDYSVSFRYDGTTIKAFITTS